MSSKTEPTMSNVPLECVQATTSANPQTELAAAGFDTLLERAISPQQPISPTGLHTGKIAAFSSDGVPFVECSTLVQFQASPAASLVPLDHTHIGRSVALMCANGDKSRPVIMGLLAIDPVVSSGAKTVPQTAVRVDGKSITFSATDEIVLQCGAASIVLTRAGKVLIRGTYLSSSSTGVNRVKGGSIQLN